MFALRRRYLRGGGRTSSRARGMVGERAVSGMTGSQPSRSIRGDTKDEGAGYLSIPVSALSLRGGAEAVAASPSP